MTALGVLSRLIGRTNARKSSRRTKQQPAARSLSRGRNGTRKPTHTTTVPPELIFDILTLAVTPSASLSAEAASASRAAQLATIARVCKATNRWAQQRLYSHPMLSQGKIEPFTRAVKKNSQLAQRVRTISVVGTGACTPVTSDVDEDDSDIEEEAKADPRGMRHLGKLKKLLALCPNLAHLEFAGIICRSLTDLDGGRQLQSLTLKDCLVVDITTTSRFHPDFLRFPSLTNLTLLRTSLDATTTALFLSPGSFPNLRSLSISHCHLIEDAHSRMRLGPLEPKSLWPVVQQLALDGLSAEEVGALEWEKMHKVEELSVPMRAIDNVELDQLPKLSHLRLLNHAPPARLVLSPHAATNSLEAHFAAAKSLLDLLDPDFPLESLGKRLSHVTVPTEWRDRRDCNEPGRMKRTLEKIGKASRKEGVKIRFDERRRTRGEWKVAGREMGAQFWQPEVQVW